MKLLPYVSEHLTNVLRLLDNSIGTAAGLGDLVDFYVSALSFERENPYKRSRQLHWKSRSRFFQVHRVGAARSGRRHSHGDRWRY